MKDFINYFKVQIWGVLGLECVMIGICLMAGYISSAYPLRYSLLLSVVGLVCALIYGKKVEAFDKSNGGK